MKEMRNASSQIKFNGAAIILARKRTGMTQEGVAKKLGVTTRTVQNWEQGLEPSAQNFLGLCEALGLEPDDLYSVDEAAA